MSMKRHAITRRWRGFRTMAVRAQETRGKTHRRVKLRGTGKAKHILSQHVGRYYFTASKCKSCTKHTTIEDGAGAIGKVEFPQRTSEGALYRFDGALVRGNPGSVSVSSVLEVWATHKTSKEKRQYCLDQGYMFGDIQGTMCPR